jgi:hypothetical protein
VEAIDHLDLVVTSLERGLRFYCGLLEPLGYVHVGEIEGERGGLKLEIIHRPSERDLMSRVQALEARLERALAAGGEPHP